MFSTSGPQVKLLLTSCTVDLERGLREGQRFDKAQRKLIFKGVQADRSPNSGFTVIVPECLFVLVCICMGLYPGVFVTRCLRACVC